MSSLLEDWLWEEPEEGASLLSEEVSLEEDAEEEDGVEDDSLEAGSDDFSLDEGGSLLGVSEEVGCSEEGMEDSVSDVPFELEGCSKLVCSVWLEEGATEEDSRRDETVSLEEADEVVPHAKSVKAAKQLRSRFFFIASHYPKFPRMGKKKRAGLTRVKDEIAYLSL